MYATTSMRAGCAMARSTSSVRLRGAVTTRGCAIGSSLSGLSIPGMKARVQRGRAQLSELLSRCCDVALDEDRRIIDTQRRGPWACGPGDV